MNYYSLDRNNILNYGYSKNCSKKVCQTKQKSPANNNNKQRRQVDLVRSGPLQKQKKVPDLANAGRRYGNKVVPNCRLF